MMKKSFAIVWLVLLSSCLPAAETNSIPAEKPPDLTKEGSTAQLPGLVIHGGAKPFIEAAGKISLTNGILEFLAVEKRGRDYESVVALDCKPSAMKFALMLIGCEPGKDPKADKPGENNGDRLRVEAEWQIDGKSKRVPAEQLILERKTKKPPGELTWLFTGSYFVKDVMDETKEVFLSDAEQGHIALWWSPAMIINVAGEHGNPYKGGDQGFEVNEAVVPPVGTPVKLILRKLSP